MLPDPLPASSMAPCGRPPARISGGWRLLIVAIGLSLGGLLAVAGQLSPAPKGFGTHQQLGLPPCTIQFLFGLRCPSCGMTTSWAHFVRGQFASSLAASAGGMFLAAIAAIACPWLLLSAARGRWVGWTPHPTLALVVTLIALMLTVLDWSVRLVLSS